MPAVSVICPGPEPESPAAADGGAFDRLAVAHARLLECGVLDPGLARLVAATVEDALARRDRALAVALRRASLHQRDELLRRAAAEFYAGCPRARAMALLQDARRYGAAAWLRDRGSVTCPETIRGTIKEVLWLAFKAYPAFPSSLRQIQNILVAGAVRNTSRVQLHT
jgi:hypothetical protein